MLDNLKVDEKPDHNEQPEIRAGLECEEEGNSKDREVALIEVVS